MVSGIVQDIVKGFETAYIDGSVASSLAYRPQFVSNNYKEGKKLLARWNSDNSLLEFLLGYSSFLTLSKSEEEV